jgi:hypothetical protein
MQACLLVFLAKYKSLANIQLENAPQKITDEKSAILDQFKMNIHQYYGILYWQRKKEDLLKYRAGTKEHLELKKCQNALIGAQR